MIKVLIRRKIPAEKAEALTVEFLKLRALAMQQPGYIGGETLRRFDTPDEYLVISRWRSVEDWSKWLVSNERRDLEDRIEAVTNIQTRFEIFQNV